MSSRSKRKPRIGISIGDPCGIGPEVTAKALRSRRIRSALEAVVFGDESHKSLFSGNVEFHVVTRLSAKDLRPGRPTPKAAAAQLHYIDALIDAAKAGHLDGMCTAPVSKEQIIRLGVPFLGHTEYLAKAFNVEVLMLMDGPRLKVALATNHLPLSEVSLALNAARLSQQMALLSQSLTPLLGHKPRLAVCGLNPHAGEGGQLGLEEVKIIAPAISKARQRGVDANGPFPADGLFAQWKNTPFDAVLAMFHDQALCVTKALDFQKTVNVTLGLPLPRTSPDHGVAYNIAGQNRADAIPMVEALWKAQAMAQKTLRKR